MPDNTRQDNELKALGMIGLLAVALGFGLGVAFDQSEAYNRGRKDGYEDGRTSCSQPSKLTKAAEKVVDVADWLSSP